MPNPARGLTDLKFWSFSFSHGFKIKIVAADVVHAATALLEGLPSATGADEDGDGESGEGGVGGASVGLYSCVEFSLPIA